MLRLWPMVPYHPGSRAQQMLRYQPRLTTFDVFLDRLAGRRHPSVSPDGISGVDLRGRRCCPRLERVVAFVLLACLASLRPLAHANPPDSIWLPGIYDGADHDDEIALVIDSALYRERPAPAIEPLRVFLRLTCVRPPSACQDPSLLDFPLRPPPPS